MNFIEHLKRHDNFDLFVLMMDELGYTDEEITTKLDISKQRIYDAKKRLEPLLEALQAIGDPKPVVYGNPDIATVVEAFKKAFGTTKVSRYDRYAAKRLAEKHTADKVVHLINALAAGADDQYAPSINSVSQLEEKLVSVVQFVKKKIDSNKVINI